MPPPPFHHPFCTHTQVHEFYGDFVALEGHHFMVPLPRPHLALQPFAWDFGNASEAVTRMTEGVASLLLSLRRRFLIRCGMGGGGVGGGTTGSGGSLSLSYSPPCAPPRPAARYQRGSEMAERFSQAMHHLTSVEERVRGGRGGSRACPDGASASAAGARCSNNPGLLPPSLPHPLSPTHPPTHPPTHQELFDFPGRGGSAGEGPPVLLVLDRRDDPVTPLLSQWTYQAMVHELLGISYNRCVGGGWEGWGWGGRGGWGVESSACRLALPPHCPPTPTPCPPRVDLSHVPGVKPEFAEAVLSAAADPFFAQHLYSNFGDLGMAVKGLVDTFSRWVG